MNVVLQKITSFVTSVCYDVAIKQKLIMANHSKGWDAKLWGLKPKGHDSPVADVSLIAFEKIKRRMK